jgi:hypothetical protein
MIIESKAGERIRSVKDWFRCAPPKRQWRDSRSAKELAKAWCGDGAASTPAGFLALLRSHELTRELVLERGIPEYVTQLDDIPGEGRNNDMVLIAMAGDRRVIVTVEAKADESFGPQVRTYVEAKRETKSRVPKRVDGLLKALFDVVRDGHYDLRYQLVHACAATLIEARRWEAKLAILVIQEFIRRSIVSQRRLQRNASDLSTFVHALAPDLHLKPGELVGPIVVPGGGFVPCGIPLLIGKVTVELAET